MKKKLFTLLLCAFAWIGVNAQTLTVTPSNVGGLDIPSGTTTIKLVGNFSGWNSGNLVNSDDDKATVTTIDLSAAHFTNENSWAFKGFPNVTNIIWPTDHSITTIPDQAFMEMGLTSVEIPNSVTYIGDAAFKNCGNLETLTFEATTKVQTFKHECFYNSGLTSVTIPGSARLIEQDAFGNINNLQTVTFAEDCTEDLQIQTHAFDNSRNVTDVYILTTAHIKCDHDAFEDDFTFAHGQVTAPKATLHFPDSEADYFTNLTHYLSVETAADPGLFQAWLVTHYQLAGQAGEGKPGWWEFISTGGSDPEGDPELGSKFLMTYSHPTHAHIVPDGVKAYIVNNIVYNSTHKLYEVQLKSISVIPARTGVILYGETNAKNSDGKGTLTMSLVTLAAPVTEGENATLYPDGATTESGVFVDLSLRRSNWEGLTRFNLGDFKNYLEPTAKVDGTTTPLNPYDTGTDGKVTFRNFGFGHFYKTTLKNSTFADYAGFFRCKKNSKIKSGKAYLKLAKDEWLSGDEVELLIKKDDGYYLRANPKSSPTAETTYTNEKDEGYWSIATWDPSEDFGVRNTAIPAAKFSDFFGENEPFFEENEATGVAKIMIPVSSVETYYNLNGQQVVNPTKGVYIKNGKKVIVK